jgi:hypothetical protein
LYTSNIIEILAFGDGYKYNCKDIVHSEINVWTLTVLRCLEDWWQTLLATLLPIFNCPPVHVALITNHQLKRVIRRDRTIVCNWLSAINVGEPDTHQIKK